MHITKKIDRAFQWAGEKMGGEARTALPEEMKELELEMAHRFDGMERMQKSMNAYVKWLGRRGETFEDKEKGLPTSYLGRTMLSHGEDFGPESEFGNCLVAMGRANERIAGLQEQFVADATSGWLESLERSLAMMKEYQSARKKLENRRLAYDASISKMQKARRDDFRIEEEMRTNKAKFEESMEDVIRRMQDITDAESDSIRDLTGFLDAELDYHERCAEELRRVRRSWAVTPAPAPNGQSGYGVRPGGRSRSNTAHSFTEKLSRTTSSNNIYEQDEQQPDYYRSQQPQQALPSRTPIRSSGRVSISNGSGLQPTLSREQQQPDLPARPMIGRANTYANGDRERASYGNGRASGTTTPSGSTYNVSNMGSLRGQLRPVSRVNTRADDVFADRDDDTASGDGSPNEGWGERSASPATSFGSLSRSTSNLAIASSGRKAPPPPPPSRSKKPPPPVPAKRETGY